MREMTLKGKLSKIILINQIHISFQFFFSNKTDGLTILGSICTRHGWNITFLMIQFFYLYCYIFKPYERDKSGSDTFVNTGFKK